MWFRCPEGTTGISVQGQEFSIEVKDKEGRGYFRAPDHFAPLIIDAGFTASAKPEGTDLPDLPKEDPERDSAIARLTAQIAALQMERDGLVADKAAQAEEIASLQAQVKMPAMVEVAPSEPEFAKRK